MAIPPRYPKQILFIDDDYYGLEPYAERLRFDGFVVTMVSTTDEALEAIRQHGSSYAAVILDSAMPPGNAYSVVTTEGGMSTGAALFQDLRKLYPTLPVLVFSMFADLDWLRKAAESGNTWIAQKMDVTPLRMVELLRRMIATGAGPGQHL